MLKEYQHVKRKTKNGLQETNKKMQGQMRLAEHEEIEAVTEKAISKIVGSHDDSDSIQNCKYVMKLTCPKIKINVE